MSFKYLIYSIVGDKIEYGDPVGIMGNMWWNNWNQLYYFNAPHRVQLGWIPQGAYGEITGNSIG